MSVPWQLGSANCLSARRPTPASLVGRLVYEKGFISALDALAPVIRKLGGVRFVVTGTAEAELRRPAWRLGRSRKGIFLGWVGDDMAILCTAWRAAPVS